MKYDKIETGVNLRQLRIENKLSPGEVSDIVDKSESHIMQLERGSRNLTVEMLCKFADVYNTDPNTILGISSQRMVVMIDKLKSLPTDTSEQLIGTFISVIDNLYTEVMGEMKESELAKFTLDVNTKDIINQN